MRAAGVLCALAMLSACGSGGATPTPKGEPTGYDIQKVDLYSVAPRDICRNKFPDSIETLIDRVEQALPPEFAGMVRFEDFHVNAPAGGKSEAMLRFHFATSDGKDHMLYAHGPFDPSDCSMGAMEGGMGSSPNAPDAHGFFEVPIAG